MFKISILTNSMALLSSRFNGFSLIGPSQKKKNRERVYWTEDQTLDRRIRPKLKLVKRNTVTKGYMETVGDVMECSFLGAKVTEKLQYCWKMLHVQALSMITAWKINEPLKCTGR